MSPRRKVDAEEPDFFYVTEVKPPRRWGLSIVASVASVLIAAVITAGTYMMLEYQDDRREAVRTAAALSYVRDFMTTYTSIEPFNANAYAERILSQGTGDFAKMFQEKANEIILQVARAEPTTGTVVDAGFQRWNDNGSADVLVATKITTKSPDGKSTLESGSRWVATTTQEGQQWKISQLIQVI